MLFERLFPFRFENTSDDCLLIRVEDEDFIVPAGACLSSHGAAIYLTSPGDAAMRAFPVRRAESRRREPTRRGHAAVRGEPTGRARPDPAPSGISAKILECVTANLV